jgi:hypothetical protein
VTGEQADVIAENQLEDRSLEVTAKVKNDFEYALLVLKEHLAAEL